MNDYIGKLKDIELNGKVSEMSKIYLEAAEETNKIVKEIYGEEKVVFPVDLNKITQAMGIKLSSECLNAEGVNRFSKILGRLITTDKEIRIEYDRDVSYKTQRYAIAHAIGRHLLKKNNNLSEISYAIPLIPASLEEIKADAIALFLLLPMDTFKEEFFLYLENCKDIPLDVDAWLKHLSDVSQISLFNLSIGYQQLKQVLCYQRQKKFIESNYNFEEMRRDKYSKIYA